MADIFISSAVRTAIGSFGGSLSGLSLSELATHVGKEAINRAGIAPDKIEQTVFGNVIHTEPRDMYLSRVAAINSGVPQESPALTLNRLCGSGLQAVVTAYEQILLGCSCVNLAGGAECMSRVGHILQSARFGQKMGHVNAIDMMKGALTDPFGHGHMGNTAENVAKNEDGCVAVFSLEMSSQSLTSRMMASMAGISQSNVKSANLTDRQWEKIAKQSARMKELNLFVDDTPNISPVEIRAKCRRLAKQFRNAGGVSLVVIDYIQLMQMPGRNENRVNELSDISRSLKYLAKEVEEPVLVLSQLNRGVEQRPNKRPQMSDLRDSGAIEQDADLIFMLYRDFVYNKNEEWKNVAELNLVKHRNGPTKRVLLSFRDELTRFGDLAPEIMNSYAQDRTED